MLQVISTTSTISTISTTTTTVSTTISQIIGNFENWINLILEKKYNFITDSNSISILSELEEEPEVYVGDLERSIQYIVNKEIPAQAKI